MGGDALPVIRIIDIECEYITINVFGKVWKGQIGVTLCWLLKISPATRKAKGVA